tara:strand:- start:4536 stop:6443 length:1908 start_codon:yes stop_codon:yes gene_type:complete
MAILSSLFGAQQQQPAVGAQPITGSEIPAELKPYYTDILSKAQALYDKRTEEGFVPYEGPTIAQFTPEQEQAFTGIAGLQGQVAPKFAEAERITKEAIAPITGEQIQEAMSPYQQAVVDIEKREAQKAFEQNVLPKVRAAQVASGSFGGTRGTLLEAQSLADQARLLSDIQTKGSQAAFQDARAALEAERTRAGQGATQLANIAPQALRTGLAELGAQQSVGEARQAQTQTALDEAYRQFLQEREQPYTDMQKYQAVVTGAPLTTTQFAPPPPPQPSLGQQLIGGLAGIGSLYGTFTGKPVFGGAQAKTGGGIAGLVKRRLPGQIGLPQLTDMIGQPTGTYSLDALGRAGLQATIDAQNRRQKVLSDIGEITKKDIAAKEKALIDPQFSREQNLLQAIMRAAYSPEVTEAGSGAGKVLAGIGKTAEDFKETEDAAKAKRLAAGTDIRQLQIQLLDAQSKGDLEAITKITDQINKLQTIEASKKSATSFEAKGGLSTTDIEKITAGFGNLDAVSDGAGGFVFKGENRPIVNAGQKIFSAARTHFNKTDEPFSQTINVPDGKGGTKAVTITLSKDDVGLSKGENLNLLSQKRQTGKLRSVETEILSRIFDSFDNEGVILKKSEEENINTENRSKYTN